MRVNCTFTFLLPLALIYLSCHFIIKNFVIIAINVQSDLGPLCDTHYSVYTSAVGTYRESVKSTRHHNYITFLSYCPHLFSCDFSITVFFTHLQHSPRYVPCIFIPFRVIISRVHRGMLSELFPYHITFCSNFLISSLFTNSPSFAVRPFKFQVSTAAGLLFNLNDHCRATEIFRTLPDRTCGLPNFLYSRQRVSFPRIRRPKCGVNYPSHLVPRLKREQSYNSPLHLCLHCRLQG